MKTKKPSSKTTDAEVQPAAAGLDDLGRVELNGYHCQLLETALHGSGGDPAWRARKEVEARELLALSQIAPPGRLQIASLDLSESLRALLAMQVPVPCRPNENNELQIAQQAMMGFTYPAEAARQPLPGAGFFQILEPREVWLPQVTQPGQVLCIAAQVPAGIRVMSLVLMAYGALSMQTVQIDEGDSAGVFAPDIARWWQQNLKRYAPLTTTPFLASDHPFPK